VNGEIVVEDTRVVVQQKKASDDKKKYLIIGLCGLVLIYSLYINFIKAPIDEKNIYTRKYDEHWEHINGQHDFVYMYSHSASKTDMQGGQGWKGYFDNAVGGETRCATTQYAVVSYFCGKDAADAGMYSIDVFDIHALRWLLERTQTRIQDSDDVGPVEMVLRANVHQSTQTAGHTFVIHALPTGNYNIYQSFIEQYTLHDYMSKNPKPLTHKQTLEFLDNIEKVVNATEWNTEVDSAYKQNFGVSLESAKAYYGHLESRTFEDKKITFDFNIACINPEGHAIQYELLQYVFSMLGLEITTEEITEDK